MRKYIFLALVLFLIPIGLSHDFNFSTATEIYNGALYRGLPKGYYDGVSGEWFVYLPVADGSEAVLTINNYDTDWTQLDTDSEDCNNAVDNCYDTDCNYIIENDRYFSCLGRENDGSPDFMIYNYGFDNKTIVTVDTRTNYLTYPLTLAVSNRYVDTSGVYSPLFIWNSFVGPPNDLQYNLNFDVGTSSSIDIPTTYHQPDNVQAVWCNDYYYLFVEKSDSLFTLVYDENLDYVTVFSLSPSGWYLQDNYYGVDSIDDTIYLVQVNDTLADNDGGLINFQGLYCEQSGYLTQVFQNTYNQTDIEATANVTAGKKITKPYITKDGNDVFNLFYQYSSKVYVSEDFASCNCGTWLNTSICSDQKIKQVRSCYPLECSDTERFIASTYCEIQYNKSKGIFQQDFKPVSGSVGCTSGWITPEDGLIASCDVYLEIPQNCTNVLTNSTMRILANAYDSIFRVNSNTFITDICNPRTDCDTYYPECDSLYNRNITYLKNYEGYLAGTTASAGFQLLASPCVATSSFWGSEGWYEYAVIGGLSYSCDIACGGWTCVKEGLVDYSVYEEIDCSYNTTTKTECSYGCNKDTGRCLTVSTGEKNTATSVFSNVFNPNPQMKVFLSLVGCAGLGFIGLAFSKGIDKGKSGGLLFMILFSCGFILFTFLGWIPVIMIIIIVFFSIAYIGLKAFNN